MPPIETPAALAAEIRRAVYTAAVRSVNPDRKLSTVLERIAAVDAVILDLAVWIMVGKNRP